MAKDAIATPKKEELLKGKKISSQEEERITMLIRQIEDSSFDEIDEAHVTEVLSQRRQINSYIHEENMQSHERFKIRQKNNLIQLGITMVFATIVLIIISLVDKQYISQALALLIGLIGGYGIGKTTTIGGENKTSD